MRGLVLLAALAALQQAETHHEALVEGRIHGFDDATVRLPFSLSLVTLAPFVVF